MVPKSHLQMFSKSYLLTVPISPNGPQVPPTNVFQVLPTNGPH
jgi:hypothetical protein